MILVSLLLVFAVERMIAKSAFWQGDRYIARYSQFVQDQGWLSDSSSNWVVYLILILPALVAGWLHGMVDNALIALIINCFVLMLAIGCPNLRIAFKGYLQAANRGEMQECDKYAQVLDFNPQSGYSFGQHIVWINFRHYMAIALWFVAFGVAGVVLYSVFRYSAAKLLQQEHPQSENVAKFLFVIEWLPARLATFGFLLVGHFSNGFAVWARYLANTQADAKEVIAKVAKATEIIEPDQHDCTEEPCTMLRLAKRNVMLLLVIVALLTLSGWLP